MQSFNPCFNGSMYKNMIVFSGYEPLKQCFNPCFNGSMYKNTGHPEAIRNEQGVSILVLMDLCIKTYSFYNLRILFASFNPCFNGSMYKNLFGLH